ncbi:flagellar hook-length control protein FliK [Neorhizobium sp. P12A]|uniref:flagellar hook-length control protein FliK n=1 Tax=Neorhizobium sp. P12A TaxID=2268027 RepID=UPI00139AD176|nr:flagellar hook-length control protein FliK [Neorhizobium sp. P12A]KAA0699521.1 flagellar hook-length control protein FliK [Neorhizobium sp. P12A]
MVGVGIPSAPVGAGSTVATKGASSAKGHGHGGSHGDDFFDVLSKAAGGDGDDQSDGEASGALDGNDGAQDGGSAGALTGLVTGASGRGRRSKPLIDLQKTSFNGQVNHAAEKTGTDEKSATAASKLQAANAAQMAKGQKQGGKGASSLETSSAGDGLKEEQHVGKTTKDTASSIGDDGSKSEQSHSKGAASDALSLLHGQSGGDPALAAQAILSNAPQASGSQRSSKDADRNATVKDVQSASLHAGADTSVADTGDADASGKAFRLSRADGRGQSLDMSIGKGKDQAAEVDVKAATGGASGADVTVLDSRRYLGLAPGSNSSAVIGSMSGDGEWSSAMQPGSALSNEASWTGTGKVVNTLKIELNPADLGVVTATMRLSGDDLTVDLKVQSGEAYRQLHNDQGAMMDALRSQGYSVDKITVTLVAPSQTEANSQSGFQGQSQQQSLPNQGQSNGQARGQNYSGQQFDGNDIGRTSGEMGREDNTSGSYRRGGSGDVYL